MRQQHYRQPKNIVQHNRILVLCEGESEIIYLKGYKSEDANRRRLSRLEIEIYRPTNYSPLGLVNEAKKKIKEAKKDRMPYKCVWIVFDRDAHANIPQAIHDAQACDPAIEIAFSKICFEYWLLLHFKKTRRLYNNCYQAIKEVEKTYLPNYSKTLNFYPLIRDRIPTALENAEWLHLQNKSDLESGRNIVDLQAYTSFDKLIKYLNDIK